MKGNYQFNKYDFKDRWISYWHQINSVLELEPKNILEIGVGNGLVSGYLKKQGKEVKTLDIDKNVEPDIVADVLEMPFSNNSFDLILCAEVLEHLPFNQFEKALANLKQVTRKNVVLSLPHFGPPIKLSFKIPFLKEIKIVFKIPFPIEHKFHGEHYWEIGKKGYSSGKIRRIIKKHFKIQKEFIPYQNQYHHFYILEK